MVSNQIYSAKYSGVDVYEFIHPTGSVMKRKSDHWVNATHILKAAKFAKAKRTRILEREVIKEIHEKVQGGFGKYQGTWVPLDIAVRLAEKFDVYDELKPLFDFTQSDGSASPPQAPKHHHASRSDSTRKKAAKSASMSAIMEGNASPTVKSTSLTPGATNGNAATPKKRGRPSTANKGKRKINAPLQRSQSDLGYPRPAIPSSSIATTELPSIRASNLESLAEEEEKLRLPRKHQERFQELDIDDGLSSDIEQHVPNTLSHEEDTSITSRNDRLIPSRSVSQSSESLATSPSELSDANPFDQRFGSAGTSPVISTIPRYATHSRPQSTDIHDKVNEYLSILVDYFISNEVRSNKAVPAELLLPPPHSAPYIDAPIDPELHTAFHWACSMGNLPIVEALVNAGTNISATNSQGQTPLMRSSMFHNSYTRRSFPRIFELLRDTVFDVDSHLQTVIHHIVKRKSSTPSAVYYLDIILSKIKDFSAQYRIELLLNYQDQSGDTALHIAAKNGDKIFFNTLIANGALSTITNKDRLSPDEIMNEQYEQIFARSQGNLSNSNQYPTNGKTALPIGSTTPVTAINTSDFMMFSSQAATRISRSIPQVSSDLKRLAERYNELYQQREIDLKNMERTLHSMTKTIKGVDIRTMEILGITETDKFDEIIAKQLEETRTLKEEVSGNRKRLLAIIEKEQLTKINRYTKDEQISQTEPSDHDDVETRIKLMTELSMSRMKMKVKLNKIIKLMGDNTKIHKYRKMISEGTELSTEEVDDCLDVILESLAVK
ncbi:hypothetical protein HG537_0E01540 [Torulaspora globosa]|uniref:Transcription factor MBP1 n=1 Tax=Torulaspora globosa TaxID=48254 RepID=A0A7H9HU34_9SACH|nr:hypothetical protein HG537_0E01540 [Torulaspora sp. CBS 2947]